MSAHGAAPPAGTEVAGPLLSARFLARLEALQLGTRKRLAGHLAGDHRSPRYGSSTDFADYREYHPGDDFRRVDYHLLARLDVALLKLFEADDDVQLRLLIDTSASMGFAGKLRQAARLAAALGFVSLVRRDPVTIHTVPADRMERRFVGRAAVPALLARLEGLAAGGTTDFAAAVGWLLARPGPPGLTVVISDLLTEQWQTALRRLPSRGGDLVVVQVLSDEELAPTLTGDVDLVDSETGERLAVSLSAAGASEQARRMAAWTDEVARRCHQAGAGYVRVRAEATEEEVASLVLSQWQQAGVLR